MRLLIFDSATHPVPYLSFDTPDYVVISLEQPELDHVQNSLKERVESAPSSLRRVGLPSGNEIPRTIIFFFSLVLGVMGVTTRVPRQPRLSQKAVNRWLVAMTLLRNPSLIKYRKQGGIASTMTVSLTSIRADISALV